MYKNIMEKKSLDYIIDFNRIIFICLCFSVLFINIFIYLYIFLIVIFCLLLFYLFSFGKSYSLICFMFAVLRVSPFSPSSFFLKRGGGAGGRTDGPI